MKETTLKVGTISESTPIIVSQTGNGDFKSITKAVEHAKPGAIIKIKSGFYEEAVVISKPLALVGDPEGLVVIANSDFAALTVKSTELKLAYLALVSGLQTPAIDIRASKVELEQSILWALDASLKKFNPCLLPARGIVGNSFLGLSMKNSLPIRLMIANLLSSSKNGLGGLRSSGPGEAGPGHLESISSPDVALSRESSFSASNSFIGLASLVAWEQSVMSFFDCRFDYASLFAWGAAALSLSGCDVFGEAGQPRVHIAGEGGEKINELAKRHEPDQFKRERDASLQLRVQEWAARHQSDSTEASENAVRRSAAPHPDRRSGGVVESCANAQHFCGAPT